MNLFKKFFLYAKLPEMRLFWFALPLLIILLVINIFYLSPLMILVGLIILFFLGIIIFINNLRLSRANFEGRAGSNELASIIFNLWDGVVAYDPNFNIVIFNRAAEQIFNLKAKEIIGQHFSPERVKEAQFKTLSEVIFPSLAPTVLRQSEPGVYPQILDVSMDEPKLELRIATDKIIDSSGNLLGFVKLVHDRTREVALLRSKTEFIAVASHQLRTPLTGIHWALESLAKENLGESQKELVDNSLTTAVKLIKTVNDLLDISKIEEGRFGYDFKEVDIIGFIEEIIDGAKILAQQSKVKIDFRKPADTSLILTIDPQKLSIVVSNLLDNAIRYNVENGEIIVSVEKLKDKPFVKISVKDTGVGIPADQINKLFTRFFRGENVLKFATEGTGLGLFIAKNIVRRHGGEIWVESEINRGSTFYFTLPIDPKLIPPKEIVYGEE